MGEQQAVGFLVEPDHLQEGLHLGGVGVWRWKIDSDQLSWTRNLEEIHRLAPGSFDGTLGSFQRDLHPEDADGVLEAISASVRTRAAYRAIYRTAPRQGEADLWIETRGGVAVTSDGERYLTGTCVDVTERVRGDQELRRRLAQQSAIAAFGSFALGETNFSKVLNGAVQLAADILQAPLTKILQFSETADHLVLRAGLGWADGLVGKAQVGTERASQAGFTLSTGDPVIVRDLHTETRFDGPQLLREHQVRSGISVVIPGSDARPFGVFGIHTRDLREFDQTDAQFLQSLANIVAGAARQKLASDHQALLVREMAHRAGNMLQLVDSIASQTFRADADVRQARQSFSERLSALGRSNYVVARAGWSSTRFAEMVEETLKPFREKIVAQGRDILLAPELCFDLGLVLHELTTNSAKYGTLGSDLGQVAISWEIVHRTDGSLAFRINWTDPQRAETSKGAGSGFGSKLIRALIETKWNGTVSTADGPQFSIRLDVPLPNKSTVSGATAGG
ncbi:sensor histidine kinase [Roseovarius sp.]|uniref:sensor histidine kinase n=1 Tax=Roseovarius sp. TaxID=1486281 RepID=UPI003A97F4B1